MRAASPLVLIHGAMQTAATWDLVAPRLEGAGRQVVVATLTGLERDAGTLTETVVLDTHIHDVVELLKRDDLHRAILVGHSYAGMVITGVAEHARDRIGHLVYVDALVPEPALAHYHLLPSVRGDLLAKLGRHQEARVELERAASLTRNARERELLLDRATASAREAHQP